MSNELDLSIGVSPNFFVRLNGWTNEQIAALVSQARMIAGVTSADASAGSGMYVDYDTALASDEAVKNAIREAATKIVPGRIPQL